MLPKLKRSLKEPVTNERNVINGLSAIRSITMNEVIRPNDNEIIDRLRE
jgi:hypothetical protein